MNPKLLVSLVISVFVIRHYADGDVYVKFDGLTQDKISAMYQKDGLSFDFTDEKTYTDYLAAHQVAMPPPDPTKAAEKQQAILDAKDKNKTTNQRLDALIKAVLQ